MRRLRVLLLADSHLGFDLPGRPRVRRRRRGHDFQANYERALAPALRCRVDLVVHGGDVFHRPRVAESVAHAAYAPLLRVAELGIPVLVVPGNHERSRLPHRRFITHPGIRLFDRPRTFVLEVGGVRVGLSGFPYQRRIRQRFHEVLEATEWRTAAADLRLLVMHHCVEGATVGPGNYTFTTAPDVVRGADLPPSFAAVLSGHIHRHQVLEHDLRGRRLPVPVLYPGSVERTAFAEMDEPKGFMTVELEAAGRGAALADWTFHRLPARPMLVHDLRPLPVPGALAARVRALIARAPRDAILRLRVCGPLREADREQLGAAQLRAMAPPTMNVELRLPDAAGFRRGRRTARGPRRPPARAAGSRGAASSILELPL